MTQQSPTTDSHNTLTPTLELAIDLMSRASVTPEDAGCQETMIKRLEKIGFTVEKMPFGDVKNFYAKRGNDGPNLCFAGHTDVVPTGPEAEWKVPPFEPQIIDGILYGRGAADMKGSLASMIIAVERFIDNNPNHKGQISFLITSDEEGPFVDGTTRVVDTLMARNEKVDWCIVGEPSSTNTLGDIIKNGRRGSFSGDLTVFGKQGHVAYPHLAKNPIHLASPAITELSETVWDQGNDFFPPTSFQVSNINAGTGATNVVPGTLNAQFNFRFSSELDFDSLKEKVISILDKHELNYEVDWTYNGLPFLTRPGELVDAITKAIEKTVDITPTLSTSGGTSDGRFIAKMGTQVVELGPINATIHQINEHIEANSLNQLTSIYEGVLENLFG
ncbi:succinyl-diaminopimelate desuccinylase [Marinomonas mediterranea]|jgi:succinyldiaminopimelate desuccinylase (EC 3.5.1.18)|uniref:Succinyl-diaminopimelate desuccinylase n=1 Tax=Marinomonas mediterranea (strain ATCC 700492 / JCM 21426 / NBRC 103028 / MMB-1) TaxID=717774 RepID=F2JTZ1_MARM1|nr:succinyl-diaminopimelate desuccinylase [Marinomonas mediterranea]ADZ90412.1 Succinyl-diaminopimelate desuccinylase [Marinomonas mediterranea MMB-1]WCN16593.1 succinyl-diaminopimelate desuccinylase [Marinomonas mediterranea MMB-1]